MTLPGKHKYIEVQPTEQPQEEDERIIHVEPLPSSPTKEPTPREPERKEEPVEDPEKVPA